MRITFYFSIIPNWTCKLLLASCCIFFAPSLSHAAQIISITTSQETVTGSTFTAGGSTFTFDGPTNNGQGGLILESFEITGGTVYEYLDLPFDVTFQRRGTSNTSNLNYFLGAPSGSEQNPIGSRNFVMEDVMNNRDLSAGVENLFETAGGSFNKQVERVDYVNTGGLTLAASQAPTDFGLAFFEREGNNRFNVAAITGIDGSGNVTSLGSIINFGDGLTLDYGTANLTGFTRTARMGGTIADPNSTLVSITTGQDLGGIFITLDDLGITVGQTFYGYVLMAGDQTTLPADINDFSAYNTGNVPLNVGGDLYGGGMIFSNSTTTTSPFVNHYWDRDGATPGAGTGATLNGIWSNDASDDNWGNQAGDVSTNSWSDNKRAIFSAGTTANSQTYTATVADNQTVLARGIRVEEGTLTIAPGNSSSTLQLNMLDSETPEIDVQNGLTTTISVTVTGTDGFVFRDTATNDGDSTLILTGNNTISGTATVEEGTLELAGTGTNQALRDIDTIVMDSGTLLLSSSNQINDTANLVLNGATVRVNDVVGHTETLGTLTLNADSTIDLGSGSSILNFADSSAIAWAADATLFITNWSGIPSVDGTVGVKDPAATGGNGTDQIYFGNGLDGLTLQQLSQIKFVNPAGLAPGTYDAIILSTGEIVPVPEPTVILTALLLFALAVWQQRKKITDFIQRKKETA